MKPITLNDYGFKNPLSKHYGYDVITKHEVASMPEEKKQPEIKESMPEEKKKPEIKERAGAISVTVWKNVHKTSEGVEFDNYSFNVERGYKDKDGKWQSTTALRLNDVPKAIALLQKTYNEAIQKVKED